MIKKNLFFLVIFSFTSCSILAMSREQGLLKRIYSVIKEYFFSTSSPLKNNKEERILLPQETKKIEHRVKELISFDASARKFTDKKLKKIKSEREKVKAYCIKQEYCNALFEKGWKKAFDKVFSEERCLKDMKYLLKQKFYGKRFEEFKVNSKELAEKLLEARPQTRKDIDVKILKEEKQILKNLHQKLVPVFFNFKKTKNIQRRKT